MLYHTFSFKKYITPGWYFNLIPHSIVEFSTIWPDNNLHEFIDDSGYSSPLSIWLDKGFRMWNSGVMHTSSISEYPFNKEEVPITDEYRFISKYYGLKWLIYILAIRLLGFNNPIRELNGFIKALKVKKYQLFKSPVQYNNYLGFDSDFVKSQPKITVIIPTLNRYPYLKDAIHDLEKQTLKPLELIVIDQSDSVDTEFYNQFNIKINLIIQQERGQWIARNQAIKESKGDWLLFFDDDSRVDSDWIEEHCKGIDFFHADISAGVSISKTGDKVPANYSFFRWADQFDSGNALVKKEIFNHIGLFDRQFDRMRMGDGEFGLRAYLNGYKSISHPFAKRIHLKVEQGGLRQVGSWDAFRTKKWFSPMPIQSVSYYYLKYFNISVLRILFFQGLLQSSVPYSLKGNKLAKFVLTCFVIFTIPFKLIRFSKSVSLAKKMIKQGPLIK